MSAVSDVPRNVAVLRDQPEGFSSPEDTSTRMSPEQRRAQLADNEYEIASARLTRRIQLQIGNEYLSASAQLEADNEYLSAVDHIARTNEEPSKILGEMSQLVDVLVQLIFSYLRLQKMVVHKARSLLAVFNTVDLTALPTTSNDRRSFLINLSEKFAQTKNSLIALHAHQMSVQPDEMNALSQTLRRAQELQMLFLSSCPLRTEGARTLCAALKDHPALRILQLRDDKLDDDGAKAVSELVKSSSIVALDLSENEIGPFGERALANSSLSSALKILNLKGNRITGLALKEALERRCSLVALNVDQTPIEQDVFQELSSSVAKENSPLKVLLAKELDRPFLSIHRGLKDGLNATREAPSPLIVGRTTMGKTATLNVVTNENVPVLMETPDIRVHVMTLIALAMIYEYPLSRIRMTKKLSRDGVVSLPTHSYREISLEPQDPYKLIRALFERYILPKTSTKEPSKELLHLDKRIAQFITSHHQEVSHIESSLRGTFCTIINRLAAFTQEGVVFYRRINQQKIACDILIQETESHQPPHATADINAPPPLATSPASSESTVELNPPFNKLDKISLINLDPYTKRSFKERAEYNFKRGWLYFIVVRLDRDGQISQCDGFAFSKQLVNETGTKRSKVEWSQAQFYSLRAKERTATLYGTMEEVKTDKKLRDYLRANNPDLSRKLRALAEAHIGNCYENGLPVGNSKEGIKALDEAKTWYSLSLKDHSRLGAMCLAQLENDKTAKARFLNISGQYASQDYQELNDELDLLRTKRSKLAASAQKQHNDLLRRQELRLLQEMQKACRDLIAGLKEQQAMQDHRIIKSSLAKQIDLVQKQKTAIDEELAHFHLAESDSHR